jgi:hypothetical protein
MGQAKDRKEAGDYPVKDWKSPALIMKLHGMTKNAVVIEAVLNPEFGKPGMTLKQKIKAAERIYDKLQADQNTAPAPNNANSPQASAANGIRSADEVCKEIADTVEKARQIDYKDGESKK